MKFTLVYAIALITLSVNGVSARYYERNHGRAPGFCKNQVLSDGTQIPQGSCSLGVQGQIPSSHHMPSTLIINPKNAGVVRANEKFDVDVVIHNMEVGFFSDPEKEYNNKPQTLNSHGLIKGHTHVTIQKLNGNVPPNSEKFAFFKGIDDKANDKGIVSVSVVSDDGKPGLSSGSYRICTMAGAFTHQPVVMPVAKRGAQDDCIRIKVK